MSDIILTTPLNKEQLQSLKIGDKVLLSGIIYTARDAAHKRLVALLVNGEKLPFELPGAVIYYAGPSPTPPGKVIGSVGPTTSGRMDDYTPALQDAGLAATIGKGKRNQSVIDSCVANKAVYFAALGGAAALTAQCVKEAEIIAWPELGAEAVRRLRVENMPLVVINDTNGNDLYIKAVEA